MLSVDCVQHKEIYACGSNSATSAIDTALGTMIIGSTALTANEVTRQFEEAGVPTKRWITGEGVDRIYRNWVATVLGRVRP